MHFRNTSLTQRAYLILLLSVILISISCKHQSETVNSTPVDSGYSYNPPVTEPTPINERADQHHVVMLDGGNAKYKDLVGNGKVVLVNFWATWCGPCRREIPDLVALQRELRGRGFEVIGLTVEDPAKDRDKVRVFAQQYSINYKIGFSPVEMFMVFNGDDPRGVIPQSFIFDRNGKLIDSVKGFRRDFSEWVRAAIDQSLNQSDE